MALAHRHPAVAHGFPDPCPVDRHLAVRGFRRACPIRSIWSRGSRPTSCARCSDSTWKSSAPPPDVRTPPPRTSSRPWAQRRCPWRTAEDADAYGRPHRGAAGRRRAAVVARIRSLRRGPAGARPADRGGRREGRERAGAGGSRAGPADAVRVLRRVSARPRVVGAAQSGLVDAQPRILPAGGQTGSELRRSVGGDGGRVHRAGRLRVRSVVAPRSAAQRERRRDARARARSRFGGSVHVAGLRRVLSRLGLEGRGDGASRKPSS